MFRRAKRLSFESMTHADTVSNFSCCKRSASLFSTTVFDRQTECGFRAFRCTRKARRGLPVMSRFSDIPSVLCKFGIAKEIDRRNTEKRGQLGGDQLVGMTARWKTRSAVTSLRSRRVSSSLSISIYPYKYSRRALISALYNFSMKL